MKNRKGFTWEEVAIVVVILFILAAIVIPQFYDKELRKLNSVLDHMYSNHCVKMEYSEFSGKISLIREDEYKVILDLDQRYFPDFMERLKKGSAGKRLGIWTFESKEEAPAPGAVKLVVWYGTRIQEQEEKADSTKAIIDPRKLTNGPVP